MASLVLSLSFATYPGYEPARPQHELRAGSDLRDSLAAMTDHGAALDGIVGVSEWAANTEATPAFALP